MVWSTVHKHGSPAARANLMDYTAERAAFSWQAARQALEGLPGGGLNIAHEAVVRHARGPHRDRVALRLLDKTGVTRNLTFGELDAQSNRFAHVLENLGVKSGATVFVLAGRTAQLYVAALGALKHRCIVCPLFAAFGPDPIRQRMLLGHGEVLVTTAELYHRKIQSIRGDLPDLRHVLVTGASSPDCLSFDVLVVAASSD